MKPLALAACLLLPAAGSAAEPQLRTIHVPAGEEQSYDEWHYAPAVRVGDLVILSGIPAWRGATYEERIRNMFADVEKNLAAAGAVMGDVVELTSFHVQPKDTAAFRAEFETMSRVHAEYFKENYPAWTAVGTSALLARDAPVEMRVMAVVGVHRNTKVQRARPAKTPAAK
jgi:enamine deaminase RidA (YjgF/YER057c/UK114 family)